MINTGPCPSYYLPGVPLTITAGQTQSLPTLPEPCWAPTASAHPKRRSLRNQHSREVSQTARCHPAAGVDEQIKLRPEVKAWTRASLEDSQALGLTVNHRQRAVSGRSADAAAGCARPTGCHTSPSVQDRR